LDPAQTPLPYSSTQQVVMHPMKTIILKGNYL
jgi:hypothetical protein